MSRGSSAPSSQARHARPDLPPRERILAAARALFYARGIRAVSVDEIAAAADTNKMTLYRHFESKDRLIAEYLRELSNQVNSVWDEAAQAHPGNARAQLEAWLDHHCQSMAHPGNRGCALANAAIEIPERDHPAREVIERHKRGQREHIAKLCCEAGFRDSEKLANEIFLLLEGARVNMQCVGREGPCRMSRDLLHALLAAHAPKPEA